MLEEGREEKCSDDDGEGMEPVKVKAEDGKENGQQQEPSSSVVLSLAEDEDDQLHPRALGKTMDVEAYANMYDGYTKILRLFFIAERCGNDTMELQALSLVHQELVKGQDNRSYIQVCEKINGRLGSAFLLDHERVDAIDLSAAHQYERLETDLNDAKSSLSKESIRMGYNDLGDFYNARGDLQQAIKCFVRARDYCITTTHIVSTYIDIILAAINLGQFHNVSNYVAKAEKTPDNEDPLVLAKLQVAAGLAHLESRSYKFAARKARIDSHKKVLHAWHPDQRNGMFQTALLTGYDLERETFAMLIRAHLLKHDMVVKGPEK